MRGYYMQVKNWTNVDTIRKDWRQMCLTIKPKCEIETHGFNQYFSIYALTNYFRNNFWIVALKYIFANTETAPSTANT